ncbi:uncharacterized protein BJX67DRAFT_170873 [Aspergillus lucknowensis]|uniref:Uncharacterized protein n=1 Tax=Aspergillus lucknowensis TaxID=176173 RepID=A0ABR4LMB7_9EURO
MFSDTRPESTRQPKKERNANAARNIVIFPRTFPCMDEVQDRSRKSEAPPAGCRLNVRRFLTRNGSVQNEENPIMEHNLVLQRRRTWTRWRNMCSVFLNYCCKVILAVAKAISFEGGMCGCLGAIRFREENPPRSSRWSQPGRSNRGLCLCWTLGQLQSSSESNLISPPFRALKEKTACEPGGRDCPRQWFPVFFILFLQMVSFVLGDLSKNSNLPCRNKSRAHRGEFSIGLVQELKVLGSHLSPQGIIVDTLTRPSLDSEN